MKNTYGIFNNVPARRVRTLHSVSHLILARENSGVASGSWGGGPASGYQVVCGERLPTFPSTLVSENPRRWLLHCALI